MRGKPAYFESRLLLLIVRNYYRLFLSQGLRTKKQNFFKALFHHKINGSTKQKKQQT